MYPTAVIVLISYRYSVLEEAVSSAVSALEFSAPQSLSEISTLHDTPVHRVNSGSSDPNAVEKQTEYVVWFDREYAIY